MNILLMVIMMGLGVFFFHGMGHHSSTPTSGHHSTEVEKVPPPPPADAPAGLRPAPSLAPGPAPKTIDKDEAQTPKAKVD